MKHVRLIIAAGLGQVAKALDALAEVGITEVRVASADGPILATGTPASITADDLDDLEIDTEPELGEVPQRGKRAAQRTTVQANSGRGRRVLYTPTGTKRQILANLEKLGKGTMSAFVLMDIAKHPETRNADVRERLESKLKSAGLSVESVDNTIWNLTRKGMVSKSNAAD